MSVNRGKAWEEVFKEHWKELFPGTFFYRIPDLMSGYKVQSQNPADYFAFVQGKFFIIECKSHDGASIDFTAIPQYERLLKYKNIENVFPGILIWFKDKDKVIWVPIKTAEILYKRGEKSIGLRHLKETDLKILDVPGEKLRLYLKCNYQALVDYNNGELLK